MLHDLSRISKLQRFYECGLPFVSSTSIRNSKRTSYFCYKLCAFKTRNRSTCVPMKIGRILVYHGKNGTRTVLARPWKVFHPHLYIYKEDSGSITLCITFPQKVLNHLQKNDRKGFHGEDLGVCRHQNIRIYWT